MAGRGRGRHEPQLDPHREKAMRSVFVANIAFETTEDQLRAVLNEVLRNYHLLGGSYIYIYI